MKIRLLNHCRIVSPGFDQAGLAIEIRDGMIRSVRKADATHGSDVFDASGLTAVPGFIDIHTHGAAGADVSDGSLEGLRRIALAKLKEGVTTFFPTTLTLSHEAVCAALETVAAYQKNQEFAKAPKVHIEGPFINPKAIGAQNPAFVRDPDAAELFTWDRITRVGIVSVAVEMPGGMEFVREMTRHGITCSLAHTTATYAQFLQAKANGLRHLTHFCNQMTPLHHREIGIVGAGLRDPDIMLEFICDTIHVASDMIALTFAVKPMSKIMLITDSMAASHQADGEYAIGGLRVIVKNGAARLESGVLAGSTLKMNEALQNVRRITGRPLADLIQTTSWNQAQSLGLKNLGKIEPGFAADLALLDDAGNVRATVVSGKLFDWSHPR